MKVAFVKDHRGLLSIEKLCKMMKISVSGFYDYQTRPVSNREIENKKISAKIRYLFDHSRKSYGCRRIQDDLADLHILCSKTKVNRLMNAMGLKSVHTHKFKVLTTDSKHAMPIAQNKLAREFNPQKPNEKWAGDMTYIHTKEGFVYLAVVLDLFSRKVIGFDIKQTMKTELCSNAFTKALALRNHETSQSILHHSDRGSQYASDEYQILLEKNNCIPSMSRKGNCWDNAVVESFFKTLKIECVYQKTYQNLNQAKEDISEYISNFYNNQRKHSALDYKSPVQYEINYNLKSKKAA